ncbi:MAG: YifB family Mg chelatase-like AAA ATPase, partial [Pseudomonadota bacterium]
MDMATVYCRAQAGIQAPLVQVEVHLAHGLPRVSIVGLAETAVKESRDRVQAALETSGFEFPAGRVTVNLAPADLPKAGGRYDLAIAVGVLVASGQVPAERLSELEFLAELGLDGRLRGVAGALPVSLAARDQGHRLVVANEAADEAALAEGAHVLGADHLLEVCALLRDDQTLSPCHPPPTARRAGPDLADVRGQLGARRALEVAATGGHNLLLYGPPGTGKTLLASRLPSIMPPLDETEALEAASVASISRGGLDPACFRVRSFRSPHHSASAAALVGGGSPPQPGEISLAHHGVLFLDELP